MGHCVIKVVKEAYLASEFGLGGVVLLLVTY